MWEICLRVSEALARLHLRLFPGSWQRARLFHSDGRSVEARLRPKELVGRGDFENEVWALDSFVGGKRLRLVEKRFSHDDRRAVWFDKNVLDDLREAGVRVPEHAWVRQDRQEMPRLVLSDLRFLPGVKRVIDLGHVDARKAVNFAEVKKEVLAAVEKALEKGYAVRSDAFLLALDKKGFGKPFVVDADWVFSINPGKRKEEVRGVREHWREFFG
ncbi:MAG: hypothetical protein AB1626_05905 [Candidatus Micrarchaeota archaeon]